MSNSDRQRTWSGTGEYHSSASSSRAHPSHASTASDSANWPSNQDYNETRSRNEFNAQSSQPWLAGLNTEASGSQTNSAIGSGFDSPLSLDPFRATHAPVDKDHPGSSANRDYSISGLGSKTSASTPHHLGFAPYTSASNPDEFATTQTHRLNLSHKPPPLHRTESNEMFQQAHGQPRLVANDGNRHFSSGSTAHAAEFLPTIDTNPSTMHQHQQSHYPNQTYQQQRQSSYTDSTHEHQQAAYDQFQSDWAYSTQPSNTSSSSNQYYQPQSGNNTVYLSDSNTNKDWSHTSAYPSASGLTAQYHPLFPPTIGSQPESRHLTNKYTFDVSSTSSSSAHSPNQNWSPTDYYNPQGSSGFAAVPLQLTSNYFAPNANDFTMPSNFVSHAPQAQSHLSSTIDGRPSKTRRTNSDYLTAEHLPVSSASVVSASPLSASGTIASNFAELNHYPNQGAAVHATPQDHSLSNLFTYTGPATQLDAPLAKTSSFNNNANTSHAVNSTIFSSSHTFSYRPRSITGLPGSASSSGKGNSGSTPSPTASGAQPDSATTPGSTTSVSAAPVLHAAAAERRRLKQEREASGAAGDSPEASTSFIPISAKAGPPKKTPQTGSLRPCIEVPVACRKCYKPLAKLSLRGASIDRSKDKIEASGNYHCLDCVAIPLRPKQSALAREGEATYADTLSAAVDRMEGLSVQESLLSHRSSSSASGTSTLFGRSPTVTASKKRGKEEDTLLACDVCRKEIASGELNVIERNLNNGQLLPVTYSPEVLCTSCEGKYLRCSDCGGGGGARGVGRWRAKEMFPGGRRTCQLSHVRQGALNEMTYDVWPITSIPPDEIEDLITMCRDLYIITLLATLAVPDMMESPSPLASTFDVVLLLATDSWIMFEPQIRENIEAATSTRRYIALRWNTSAMRRRNKNSEDRSTAPTLSKEGRTLGGFILGEQDLLLGSCHVALTIPSGSGESYDAGSRLMHSLFRHIQNDIASINVMRSRQKEPLLPQLKQAWTMHMVKRDSRMMNRIETKRGFVTLEEYLATYPDAKETDFAPHRPIFLPPDLLKGWQCFVKRITDNDDWLVTTTRRGQNSSNMY